MSSSSSSCVVEAFSALLRFGVDNNKPSVLRAIVGRLTVHGRQSPGGCGCGCSMDHVFTIHRLSSCFIPCRENRQDRSRRRSLHPGYFGDTLPKMGGVFLFALLHTSISLTSHPPIQTPTATVKRKVYQGVYREHPQTEIILTRGALLTRPRRRGALEARTGGTAVFFCNIPFLPPPPHRRQHACPRPWDGGAAAVQGVVSWAARERVSVQRRRKQVR